jgi:hypothetical protein
MSGAFPEQPLKTLIMKKFLLLLLVSAVSFSSVRSQNVTFGFTAGVAIANYKLSADNISMKFDSKAGLTAGFLVDVPCTEHFSFQPALNFVQKGVQSTDNSSGITVRDKSTISMLEIPFNFLYNTHGNTGNFFAGAGPSVAFGLSGKSKTTYSDGTPDESSDIKFGSTEDDDLKGFDLGANFLAGYNFSNGLMLALNFNQGLSNLVPKPEGNEKMKSHYIGIRLGWMLHGKAGKETKK